MTEPIQSALEDLLVGAPAWVQQSLPFALRLLVVAFAVWFVSWLVKSALKAIGRRRMTDEETFEGSSWDLGASLMQFFVLLVGAPLVLSVIGFNIGPFMAQNAGGILTAFVILAVGIALSRGLSRSIQGFGARAKKNQRADDTLFHFLSSMVRYVVLGLAVVFALQQVGFQTGSLIAIVGAAGLAIALALQDTLRAVAAGVLLAVFRPYRLGDWVLIADNEGEVIDITPFHTMVKTIDVRMVVIPNDKAWSDPITNFTHFSERRANLFFDIAYEDDPEHAMGVIREAISVLPRCRRPDDIWIGLHELGSSSVTLRVRPWVARADFIDFRSDCLLAVKQAFEGAGITIPFPQQVEYSRPYAAVAPKPAGDAMDKTVTESD